MGSGNSKEVYSNQEGIHPDLELINKRYNLNYQRPIADFSHIAFEEIISFCGQDEIIFDFGCGIGESSKNLAQLNPDKKIVGIDKSLSRILRKNQFKKDIVPNMLLIRGELLDLIYLIYKAYNEEKIKVSQLYILYPNPWPKKIHVKRRFHGNPIAPFLFEIKTPLYLRSNWKMYLDEFASVGVFYGRTVMPVKEIVVTDPLTPFEKKYIASGQKIYELMIS